MNGLIWVVGILAWSVACLASADANMQSALIRLWLVGVFLLFAGMGVMVLADVVKALCVALR